MTRGCQQISAAYSKFAPALCQDEQNYVKYTCSQSEVAEKSVVKVERRGEGVRYIRVFVVAVVVEGGGEKHLLRRHISRYCQWVS